MSWLGCKTAPLCNTIDGCYGPFAIIDVWQGHFQYIFNNVSNLTDTKFVEDRINCISAHHITNPSDIEEEIDDLKTGKAQCLTTFMHSI